MCYEFKPNKKKIKLLNNHIIILDNPILLYFYINISYSVQNILEKGEVNVCEIELTTYDWGKLYENIIKNSAVLKGNAFSIHYLK